MGDGQLNIALAHGVLAISSGYSLSQCSDLQYARVAFCLYLANGVVGVVDYVMPSHNAKVRKILDIIARVSKPLYLPLVAAEAILFAGFDEMYSYCHLVFPVLYLLLTELLKKKISSQYLDLSTLCNTISLGFSAYTKEDIYGGVCAIINFGAFLGTQFNSMEYLILIAVGNIAAVQFFKQLW